MGEVGGVIPEKQSESPAVAAGTAVNGEVNGVCKVTVGGPTTESMDVDTEEDSQVSSDNGISDASESHSVTNTKRSATSKLNALGKSSTPGAVHVGNHKNIGKTLSIHSEENSQHDLEAEDEEASGDLHSNNGLEMEVDNSQGDENTRTTTTSNDENSQDGVEEDAKEGLSLHDNYVNMTTEGEETTNDNSTQNNPLEEENSQSSQNSGKSECDLKENGMTQKDNQPQDENEDSLLQNSEQSKAAGLKTKENGNMNGPKAGMNISDDITIIESDDDDEEPPPAKISPPIVSSKANSSSVSTKPQPNAEEMEVDSTVNSSLKGSGYSSSKASNPIDDDAPVIIPSDSETEDDDASQEREVPKEMSKLPPVDEDMSGDDCVVIEDDEKKEKSSDQDERTVNRPRKSILRPRDVEDDDDIAEIVDDLPPSKKPRTNAILTPTASPNLQIGQITIKDARSLMPQFPDSQAKSTFQQQFAQSVGIVASNTNKTMPGVLPMAPAPQSMYPNNIRPPLAPLSAPPKLVPTTTISASPTLPVSNPNLLPALTDDMFVLEAPSFIVPYIYEKPPAVNLKDIVLKLEAEIQKVKVAVKEPGSEEKKVEQSAGDVSAIEKEENKDEKKGDHEKSKRKKKSKNPDDSWDEFDTSTDEEASDSELRTKVLIKDSKPDLDTIKAVLTPDSTKPTPTPPAAEEKKNDPKNENYFEGPLGKFFIDIGINLVQEYVQTDLLRIQKRKLNKSLKSASAETELAIRNLQKNIEASKKRNETFKFDLKRCEYCNFKSESALAMAHHYETPHMRQYLYKCNLCPYETRPAHDILFHMEAVHNIKGRLEKALGYNQCPNCPFEENGKAKFARHVPVCAKKFRPEVNLQPPHDWEAPAKIPRIKPRHGLVGTATAYQAMAAQAAAQKAQLAAMAARAVTTVNTTTPKNRGGRPPTVPRLPNNNPAGIRGNAPIRQPMPGVVLPSGYQIAPGGQIIQVAGSNLAVLPNPHNALNLQQSQQQSPQNLKKNAGQQPSISITPLPRQPGNASNPSSLSAAVAMSRKPPSAAGMKPGQAPSGAGGKASFVICEICDGYIKDLEQLRNHMQWMHKVKIHPKMIHNRPPLNCQKCQFRFFTDQGLERHLLGSHGLVTSSMQQAANGGKDAGRCPVCGRMYQWKLLNHVSRDHQMTLKPAHLSYKCTVCTATFGMYKEFENHVYTAHSTVAKKAMDGKKNNSGSNNNNPMAGGSNSLANMSGITVSTISGSSKLGSGSSLSAISSGDSLLKPLKINDEITIIPQPASKLRTSLPNDYESHLVGKSSGKR